MYQVYGYWVGKDEIIEVPTYGHSEIAEEILRDRYHIPPSAVYGSDFSFYQFMFKLGFIRIVNELDGTHCVQYHDSTKLSRLQKQFVTEASRVHIDSDNAPLDDLIIEDYVVGVQSHVKE